MKIAQVSFYREVEDLPPARLVQQWRLDEIPAALNRSGHEVRCFVTARRDGRHTARGVDCLFIADRGAPISGGWGPPRRVLSALSRWEPDIIHVHGLGHFCQLMLTRLSFPDTPIVVQDHASKPPPRRLRRPWRASLDMADRVLFVDRRQATPFYDAGALSKRVPISEVLEATTSFSPGDQAAAQSATGLHGDPCLLWVGDLNANKDPLTVLEGVAQASQSQPGLHLWCVFRNAPLRDQVESRITGDPRLRGRVTLIGEVPHRQLEQYHRAADFFVLGSHSEGGAYSALEALACGNTPVVSDIPAFERIAGAVGARFRCGQARALAEALADARPDRRGARARFEATHTVERVADRLASIYRLTAADRVNA